MFLSSLKMLLAWKNAKLKLIAGRKTTEILVIMASPGGTIRDQGYLEYKNE